MNRQRWVWSLAPRWAANGWLRTDNDLLRTRNDLLWADNDSLWADNDSLWAGNDLSFADNDSSWTRNESSWQDNDPSCAHNGSSALRNARAFSLVEILVVVSLMSLVVLALMAVFSSTQRAFRSSVTQSDVLEGSRATMEMIAADLRALTPSGGYSNAPNSCPVNLFTVGNYYYDNTYTPLLQTLPGSSVKRENVLNYFFVLGRENTKWTATGYIVDNTSTSPLYPLYRFYSETNAMNSPQGLVDQFVNYINGKQWTNMSHLIDGVVHLTIHAYDTNGTWINNLSLPYYTNANNTLFIPSNYGYGIPQFYMFSNTVPAAVELELGVLEDHTLQRAESLPNASLRAQYLSGQAGTVHLFRQRVTIPNVDPTAYQ